MARLGSPARAGAVLRVAQVRGHAVMAAVSGAAGLLAGYLTFSLVHEPSNAVTTAWSSLTDAEHRTAMVSVNSLTMTTTRPGLVVTVIRLVVRPSGWTG